MMMKKLTKFVVRHLPGSETNLNYIHIGKCGGATLWNAIQQSEVINARFTRVERTHVKTPIYKDRTRYLFVVRNPIDRALSAFNWRHKLVVEDAVQKNRIPGEYDILKRYGTLEALALALYPGGQLDERVARELRTIHHLREDIAFYLDHGLGRIGADQVFAVLCQKSLDDDILQYLGVGSAPRIHDNKTRTAPEKLTLSDQARANLGRFLERDYACLTRLEALFPLPEEKMAELMRI